ncbi:hypothetical protein SUGI_0034450 [Cryptomeria japonica]|uniref:disease resistance protein RPV1 n=1 Tax=Cryptomeria japonica TaxID=3369 RepID=UPI002408D820|nr:disease resistance protein RPV1 [Cryptomeria japonica]GLJ06255.1 hypothetical protein SUGI_0034450 [Cryptomeria japonica]
MECEPSTSIISFDLNNKFHVFLSFRGPDVRNTFVDHLYAALSAAGLRVFLDSEELEKGKGIDSSLQTAIQTSDILIPIFSKGYAESTWCLEEAARMCRSNGLIIPLFYDVEPCDVRYPQRKGGLFTQAFEKHYTHLDRHDEKTIEQWKGALHQISELSGWSLKAEFGHEGRLVKAVVKGVLDKLKNRVPLDVPTHLVGFERGIHELTNSLHLNSMDISLVRVGISGIGGVGKTTLAKVVYNEVHRRFDACCFLFNIGATAQNSTRLMDLQGRILRSLVNYHGEVPSVDEGRSLMRDRLRGVRALLILDDVNDGEQLHAVYGDWFGHGSRVIITSRDQHILNLAKVDSVLKMSGLGNDEGLELFSWHAFSSAFPETPYQELSIKIVSACQGHPLALEVIGSHLFDKRESNDIRCWEEAVHNIGEYPSISRILQTSYDGLTHVEKEIFLDIACCFVGESKRDADIIWEVLYPNKVQTAIKNLSLKMLINIRGHGFLHMHDLLQEMGRGIQEQADNNSRLWPSMVGHKSLNKDRAEEVKMLVYTGENKRDPVSLHNMPSLRYLFLQNTKVAVNFVKLAPNLICIKIRDCEIVSDRHTWMMSRTQLQFDSSWSQVRIFSLEKCAFPTKIPNTLNSLVNLQRLYIQHCKDLTTLPSTVGNLLQLKELKLCGCKSLKRLPDTVGNLVRLEVLCLGDCADLKSLPSTLGNLAQLQSLSLVRCTGLRSLPNTIGDLAQLMQLNLQGCSGLQGLPKTIGDLAQLEWLSLFECSGLQRLPYTVGMLSNLKFLNIHGCSGLGSFHHIVVRLAQLRESNRSAGLGSLVQKKFHVYVGFNVDGEQEGEALMGHLQKSVRICRGRKDDQSLCTESLRICRGREDGQSRDNSWAIDNSDILVEVLSRGLNIPMRNSNGLNIPMRKNGLNIPFFPHEVWCRWHICRSCY